MGDKAIFCEGLYQGWLHCKCAGLSSGFFQKFTKTNKKFLCVFCQLFEQVSLTEELKEDIKDLKAKLSEVPPDLVNTDQASLVKELKDDVKNLKAKFLVVTPVSVNNDSNSSNSLQLDLESTHTSNPQQQNPAAITSQPRPRTTVSERNLNVVIYGISKCPKNTSKPTRSKSELDKFLPALSKVDPSIQSTSIKRLPLPG